MPRQEKLDAARWRHILDYADSTHQNGRWTLTIDGPGPSRHDLVEALDAAIDADMKEKKQAEDDELAFRIERHAQAQAQKEKP